MSYVKAVNYDVTTRDFAAFLNDELVGFYATYHAAEVALDALVYDLLTRQADEAAYVDSLVTVEPNEVERALANAAAVTLSLSRFVAPAPAPASLASTALDLQKEALNAARKHIKEENLQAARDQQAVARAYAKAAKLFDTRPESFRWIGDVMLVDSEETGGVVYTVRREGCTCKAAEKGRACKHAAMRWAWERKMDALELAA